MSNCPFSVVYKQAPNHAWGTEYPQFGHTGSHKCGLIKLSCTELNPTMRKGRTIRSGKWGSMTKCDRERLIALFKQDGLSVENTEYQACKHLCQIRKGWSEGRHDMMIRVMHRTQVTASNELESHPLHASKPQETTGNSNTPRDLTRAINIYKRTFPN